MDDDTHELAIGYLLLALPVHLGVLPDVGLFVQAPDSALARIVLIVGTELGLLTAYGVGRLARRKHGRVVEELEAVLVYFISSKPQLAVPLVAPLLKPSSVSMRPRTRWPAAGSSS